MDFKYMGIEFSGKRVEFELRESLSFNDMVRNYKSSYISFSKTYHIIKGGITGAEPQEIFNNYLQEAEWERMIILYQLQTVYNVKKMEDYIMSCYPEIITSWMGTSEINKEGDNYIYFLMK